ncbi:ATP-binding protein [Thermodesulfobacteriota bacterium B35]
MKIKRKLANYILAAFFLNIFAIISVGGVCIILVRDMARDNEKMKTETEYVVRIYDMNNKIQEAVFLVQNSVIRLDRDRLRYALSVVGDVEREVALSKEEETDRGEYGLKMFLLFQQMEENVRAIKRLLHGIDSRFDGTGPVDKGILKELERRGYRIQKLVESINRAHFGTIEKLVDESNGKMYYILFLYLTSCAVGIVASCIGYIALTRYTIIPIMHLAEATERVTFGDLSVRVQTDSKTELGALYSTFNLMTRNLQEHERQQEEFNRELERLVEERTAELRASEASLRKTQKDLLRMEKIATLGQIASTVNHEIKTPLNVLYMNLQLLNKEIRKAQVREQPQKEKMLKITSLINNEIVRINGIIEEFVKYARFPAPEFDRNDLNAIVDQIAEIVHQSASDAGVRIEVEKDGSLEPIMLDEKKITQALLNLCMNAIQAMPEGGTLKLSTRREDAHVLLRVSDTGKGIEAADLEKIFEPFFTKKVQGMGFGLAIVQRIIEDHGGQISCESEPGKRTVFTIRLPIDSGSQYL